MIAAALLLTGITYAPSPAEAAPAVDCADVLSLELSGVTLRSATVVSTLLRGRRHHRAGEHHRPAAADRGLEPAVRRDRVRGLCGNTNINYGQAAGCRPIVDGTVASATTDMGHQGQNDGSWAAGNPQAQIDLAYRGVHVTALTALTALTAKVIIKAFYGRAPAY